VARAIGRIELAVGEDGRGRDAERPHHHPHRGRASFELSVRRRGLVETSDEAKSKTGLIMAEGVRAIPVPFPAEDRLVFRAYEFADKVVSDIGIMKVIDVPMADSRDIRGRAIGRIRVVDDDVVLSHFSLPNRK